MSDHKNDGSLRSYNRKVSSTQKLCLSSSLSKILNPSTSSSSSTATTDRDKQMAISEFPPSTGRPINPVGDVLRLLPVTCNQAQSSVSNLEMIDNSYQRSSVFQNYSFSNCHIHFHK